MLGRTLREDFAFVVSLLSVALLTAIRGGWL